MRTTGDYATIGGVEFRVVARGVDRDGWDYVGLLLDDAAAASAFEHVVDRRAGGRMAKVGRGDLDRFERVVTTGTVDGATVTLYGLGDVVPCTFVGDPAWADAHGFVGSPYDGWSGEVPRTKISDVHETVTDLLHPASAGDRR